MATLGKDIAMAQAFSRFGLGGRPDDPLPADPIAWLQNQLTEPDPAPVAGKPTQSSCLAIWAQWLKAPPGPSSNAATWALIHPLFAQEQQDMLAGAVLSTAPFRERLVRFWTNHFAIMANSPETLLTTGSFVRDAIRPNVTGTFSDMLLAVMRHPAMLYSLDNTQSIGPQSPAGLALLKNSKGKLSDNINENLGRETLELYTVGVNAGYAQSDVDAMGYLLTGWTVNVSTAPYGFFYNSAWAQPGSQSLLGTSYPNTQAGCVSALAALATNPYTYQHLATKLVSHFVSDTPAASDIAAIAGVLSATGGNLGAAAKALVLLPSAWQPLTKLRTPQDLVIAALRAANTTAGNMPAIEPMLAALGQPLWQPPFPNGWSDLAADWTGPQQMLLRCDCMSRLANGITAVTPAVAVAGSVGPFLSANTAAVMNRAPSTHDRFATLFCSPEFQRR
jgi:uncharacterized protein (DUF1800 family)